MYSWESRKYWITCRVIMSGEILMCCIAQLLCWLTTGETTPPINFKHNSKWCWAIVFRYLIKFDKTSLRKDQHREEKLISFIDNFFFWITLNYFLLLTVVFLFDSYNQSQKSSYQQILKCLNSVLAMNLQLVDDELHLSTWNLHKFWCSIKKN